MKKKILSLLLVLLFCPIVKAETVNVYSVKNLFGLRTETREITKAEYSKLVRLGDNSFIAQKRHKFGIIDKNGNILIPIKYRWADRVASNYVKLGTTNNFGVYDEFGNTVINPEYSSIERISKDCFLTCKNYKYGLVSMSGDIVLRNQFDSIYIPDPNTVVIQYKGEWYKLDVLNDGITFEVKKSEDEDLSVGEVLVKTGAISGYSVVTFTDYVLKLFSSLSPAYEATIDELMFARGADAVPIIMNFTWLPKMPFTFIKNYYQNIRRQETDILSPAKNYLEKRI